MRRTQYVEPEAVRSDRKRRNGRHGSGVLEPGRRRSRRKPHRLQAIGASAVNAAVGGWLVAAPFALGYLAAGEARWNDTVVGAMFFVLAAVRVVRPLGGVWPSWSNVSLGLWLVFAPFLLGYSDLAEALISDVASGVAAMALGIWSALATLASRD